MSPCLPQVKGHSRSFESPQCWPAPSYGERLTAFSRHQHQQAQLYMCERDSDGPGKEPSKQVRRGKLFSPRYTPFSPPELGSSTVARCHSTETSNVSDFNYWLRSSTLRSCTDFEVCKCLSAWQLVFIDVELDGGGPALVTLAWNSRLFSTCHMWKILLLMQS